MLYLCDKLARLDSVRRYLFQLHVRVGGFDGTCSMVVR